jgi:hypothetical protein
MVQHLQAEGILYPLDADLLSKEIEEHRKAFLEKVTLFYQHSVKSIHDSVHFDASIHIEEREFDI